MKYIIILLILFVFSTVLPAQNIKLIAAYDNNSSTTSGLYAVGDTAIYRFSWFYQEWFPLSNNGLIKVNDTVQLSALAVYNNESSNSSGLFVFSDTAVFNYNWITMVWYPISNTGLPRINQKPNVKSLSVYGPAGSSSNSTLFAMTDTAVFRYSWSYQQWSSISNAGISTLNDKSITTDSFSALAYPNPFNGELSVDIDINETSSGTLEIALFDMKGNFIFKETHFIQKGEKATIKPSLNKVVPGIYFMEVFDGHFYKQLKLICVK